MKDIVEYEIPYKWLGRLLHRLVIRRKLEYIFEYRGRKIHFLFQSKNQSAVHSQKLEARS
jgi:hypothetical protein